MNGVDWRFPAILVAAMLIGVALTWLQMRSYNAELRKASTAMTGEHLMLVSGRGRSMAGGAILIAIVDTATRQVVWARAMSGATVFARFRDRPELLGSVDGAAERVHGRQLKAAVEMAMVQLNLHKNITQPARTASGLTRKAPATAPRPDAQ
ncbi:hypothetical protein HMPREF1531_00354 [Propionibacterium sp. oral taxon 192 str. F0372]|uniref:transcriptional regulator GutM n=1 Tax=Propionibacterium sp. oral taxon 192 TaxID=671222 RepID=UPI0003536D26|nr:transcriptional regulator GutM [Propionibacterium sp. oral taxon 192]EPH06752.1 hypothetical protein HMPREF1531_00354 [Propionibacterium sp. oral taxon 192 str. F0372]